MAIERIVYDTDGGMVPLRTIEIGASFKWDDDYLCRRINLSSLYVVYDAKAHCIVEGIPAIVVASGDLSMFDPEDLVMPVKVEHHVVG